MRNIITISESIDVELSKKKITVFGMESWDIQIFFEKDNFEPTLDDDGGMFEPVYTLKMSAKHKKDVSLHNVKSAARLGNEAGEIKKLFVFAELNKENWFEVCGFIGKLK